MSKKFIVGPDTRLAEIRTLAKHLVDWLNREGASGEMIVLESHLGRLYDNKSAKEIYCEF